LYCLYSDYFIAIELHLLFIPTSDVQRQHTDEIVLQVNDEKNETLTRMRAQTKTGKEKKPFWERVHERRKDDISKEIEIHWKG